MSKELAASVLSKHERQMNSPRRTAWNGRADLVRRYVAPTLPQFSGNVYIDSDEYPPLLDDTGKKAARRLTDALHVAVTPSQIQWVQFEHEDEKADLDLQVREARQFAERQCQQALDYSNFQCALDVFWFAYTTVATGILYGEDLKKNGVHTGELRFEAFSPARVSLWEDAYGKLNAIGRKYKSTAGQIVQRWKKAINISAIAQAIDEKKLDTEFEILHYAGPDEDIQPRRFKDQQFVSLFILCGENAEILNRSAGEGFEGYELFPYWKAVYNRVEGFALGSGPGFDCLEDIRELSWIQAQYKKGVPHAINPPWLEEEDAIISKSGDSETIQPGDRVILQNGKIDRVRRMEAPNNFGLAELLVEKRQQSVREWFHWDEIQLRKDKYNMTRDEVAEARMVLNDLLAKQVTGTYETAFSPLIEWVYNTQKRAGRL